MGKIRDRAGERFGKLTVIKLAYVKKQAFWECLCDCGNTTIVISNNLKNTKSCGCHRSEQMKQISTIHGFGNSRLSHIYNSMKQRCYNPNNKDYKNYGERNIVICDEWLEAKNFFVWATSNGYKEDLTIERLNVNGNYEPTNCIWTTMAVQSVNRRNNRLLTAYGKTQALSEWVKETNITKSKITYRLNQGMTLEEAIELYKKQIKGD